MWLIYILWVATLGLQTGLAVHLLHSGLAARYPYFFAYLAISWASSGVDWVVYHRWISYYRWVYWTGELVTVLALFLVVGEIFRQTFLPFPAIRRAAAGSLLGLSLVILCAVGMLLTLGSMRWDHVFLQVERWARFLQAGLLAATFGTARYYFLPLGRNIGSLAVGAGLYVSFTIVNFVFLALARIDLTQFGHLYAVTYLLTLAIWFRGLWVYAPNPLPLGRDRLEQDYARVNAAVVSALTEIRGSMRKALRA